MPTDETPEPPVQRTNPVDPAGATTGASVIAGGLWNSFARVLPQVYTVAISITAARFLEPDLFGRQSFISFAQLSLVLVLSSGLASALVRFIGETLGRGRPELVGGLLLWAWRLQIGSALLGGGLLAVVGISGSEPRAAWLLAGLACFMSILQSVPSSVLIGAQRWREASIVGLVTTTVSAPAVIAVLALGGGIVGIFAVEAVVTTINLVWAGALARRALKQLSPRPQPAGELQRSVLRFTAIQTAQVVLTLVVWRRSEFLFLEAYSADAQIGFYSIAFAAVTVLMLVPETLNFVTAPAFATLHGAGARERISAGYSRALRLLVLASLPLTAGGLALGPAAIEIVYGRAYAPTGPVLVVMVAALPFVALSSISTSLLVGVNRIRGYLLASAFGAVVVIGLNFWLIPEYDAVGAAIANTAGQLSATLPVVLYANHLAGGVRWEAATMLRATVLSAIAGAGALAPVLLFDGALHGVPGFVAGLILGTILFIALAVPLRVLTDDDASWLDAAAGHRLGGIVGRACRAFGARSHPGSS